MNVMYLAVGYYIIKVNKLAVSIDTTIICPSASVLILKRFNLDDLLSRLTSEKVSGIQGSLGYILQRPSRIASVVSPLTVPA